MPGAFIADARGGYVWIHGSDGTATPVKVLVDGDGHLQIDALTVPTVTVEAAGGDKIFSFEGFQEIDREDTNLDAGTNDLTSGAVPAGKVWMVYIASMRFVGTVPTRMLLIGRNLAGDVTFLDQASPVSGQNYIWQGELYLKAGDRVKASIVGATAGDEFYYECAALVMDAP